MKWIGIAAGSLIVLVILMFEVAFVMSAADSYKASIVRETVAAMKDANGEK